MAPYILHLFSGSLIFESVLKNIFPLKDDVRNVETLGYVFHTSQFQKIYCQDIKVRATTLSEILSGVKNNSLLTTFSTTAKIRNTTGLNLIWDECFTIPSNYELLCQQILNSIFYIASISY